MERKYDIIGSKHISKLPNGNEIMYLELAGKDENRPSFSLTDLVYPSYGSLYFATDKPIVYIWNEDDWSVWAVLGEEDDANASKLSLRKSKALNVSKNSIDSSELISEPDENQEETEPVSVFDPMNEEFR